MRIVISKSAGRALERSHKRKLIAGKIRELSETLDSLSANVVMLKGKPGYRLRVQDWRIIFRIENEVLYIDEVEPRGSVYGDRT